jgi:Ca2+-binding RTX toxin-like protein
LTSIDVARAFAPKTDLFFNNPAMAQRDDDITGEVTSLYFGPHVTVRIGGVETALGSRSVSTSTYHDPTDLYGWTTQTYFLSANKTVDLLVTKYDNGSVKFTDLDESNSHNWQKKTTLLTPMSFDPTSEFASPWSRIDYITTIFDDNSRNVFDYDQTNAFEWSSQDGSYTRNGQLYGRTVLYDDGRRSVEDLDPMNFTALHARTVMYNAEGTVATSIVTYDDGHVSITDWAEQQRIDGTLSGETLGGTDAADLIRAGSGPDTLIGGPGADYMQGDAGNDLYYIDDAGDTVIEAPGSGIDTVNSSVSYVLADNVENLYLLSGAVRGAGNSANNAITGSPEGNRLDGLEGDDRLAGRGGNDTLVGGDGRDQLDGGSGLDTLFGRSGADTFLWRNITDTGATSSSADLVMDFSYAQGDRLHLALIDAIPGGNDEAFSFIGTAAFTGPAQIRYLQSSSETRLLLNTDNDARAEAIIRLDGFSNPDTSWFIL